MTFACLFNVLNMVLLPNSMIKRVIFPLLLGGLILSTIQSCGSSGSGSSEASGYQVSGLEKPVIDSSKVPETLELYRARRYESIGEARSAGVENVYKLVLYGRELTSLPGEIKKLKYLASLDVANN